MAGHSGMSKRILMIAYVFPPIAYAGTYRTLRLCAYLAKAGHSVHVLTINEQKDLHNDHALLEPIRNVVEITRTRTIDLWRQYQKIKDCILGMKGGKALNQAMSALIYPFCLPDHMALWVPFAFLRAISLMRRERFDLIYTSSPPHSQQLVGLLLKRATGIPWVADLRDPILDNLFCNASTNLEKRISTRLEQSLFNHADVVVANTRTARDLLHARYPEARVHSIYNSFDRSEFRGLIRDKYERFTLAHVGSIYGSRKASHLLKAIQLLLVRGSIDPLRLRVSFVGLNDPDLRAEVSACNLGEVVEIRDMVSHREALEIMVRSHLLVLIKGFGENSGAQIPGKFFEYQGAGTPILCISSPETELSLLVRENHLGYVAGNSPEEIAPCIIAEYQAFENGQSYQDRWLHPKGCSFSSEAMGREFVKLFSALEAGFTHPAHSPLTRE